MSPPEPRNIHAPSPAPFLPNRIMLMMRPRDAADSF